jgi:hypothetical protein
MLAISGSAPENHEGFIHPGGGEREVSREPGKIAYKHTFKQFKTKFS